MKGFTWELVKTPLLSVLPKIKKDIARDFPDSIFKKLNV